MHNRWFKKIFIDSCYITDPSLHDRKFAGTEEVSFYTKLLTASEDQQKQRIYSNKIPAWFNLKTNLYENLMTIPFQGRVLTD